ncbi:helix-turn-helix domain-containing protein [Paenibacillus sp. NPDC056722]|uniref:helix-turn-helix domain-containing protein n=1 Tax=Paenibacillus sp. NPDC056722 TaxID=3345924 RepID=UPI0036B67EB5
MDHGRVNRAIGHALSVRRKDAGKTMAQMWDSLGWGRMTYRRTEEGAREISVADVLEFAELLGIEPEDLVLDILRRLKTNDFPQPTPASEMRRQLGL